MPLLKAKQACIQIPNDSATCPDIHHSQVVVSLSLTPRGPAPPTLHRTLYWKVHCVVPDKFPRASGDIKHHYVFIHANMNPAGIGIWPVPRITML